MKQANLSSLAAIGEILYLREYGRIQDVLAHEARLVRELGVLESHSRQARHLAAVRDTYSLSGATAQWEVWAGRATAALDTELVQVRTKKRSLEHQYQAALARKIALDDLTARATAKMQKDRVKAGLASLAASAGLCRNIP